MLFSYQLLALATVGMECAFAQPHQKHHHHHKRVDFNDKNLYKDVDWSKVFGQKADAPKSDAPKPEVKESDVPKPDAPKPDNASTESSTGGSTGNGFGGRSTPKDDGVPDHYIGNVGLPYGSNMKLIPESDESKYDYTNQFCSESGKPISIIIWNKSGSDGQPQSGMSLPPNIKFDLNPGECRYVAFDQNTQAGFSKDCARDPLKGNIPQCPWGEVDFGNQQNGGWSGYDRSTIVTGVNSGLLTISCEGAETSSEQNNSFTSASQTNAGGSLPPGPVHFKSKIGD